MLYADIAGIDRPLSRLVLGTGSFSLARLDVAMTLLDAFAEAGGNTLDTAAIYGRGQSELAVGRWLKQRGNRDRAIIVTKGAHPRIADWRSRLTRDAVAEDIARSLERLQVSTIDLYLLHRDDSAVPVAEVVDILAGHVADGHIRAYGASNWSYPRIQEANSYAAVHGLPGFVASSPTFSLAVARESLWPGIVSLSDDPIAQAWYGRSGLPILAWSSQAKGFFSGRFTRGKEDGGASQDYDSEDNWLRLERARKVAQRHQCTPTQVALSWLFAHPLAPFAIIGPGSLSHLQESLGALDVHLSADEIAWLDLRDTYLPFRWEPSEKPSARNG